MKNTIIVDFGAPESLDQVDGYLYRLFCDPNIIPIPVTLVRKAVARLIALTRRNKSRNLYESIGGRSPLNNTVKSIAQKLSCDHAFKYCPPFIDDVLKTMIDQDVVVLPLFPYYSFSTVKGIVDELDRYKSRVKSLKIIQDYYRHPDYQILVANSIKPCLKDDDALLVTAHAIPESFIAKGDPYCNQIIHTFSHLQGTFGRHRTFLAFQSRMGPVKWIGPSVEEIIPRIHRKGFRQIAICPLGFMCDNLETLRDLDIVLKTRCLNLGFTTFKRVPCFNDGPEFINFLKKLTSEQ
jgi:ferrochelatase